MIDLISLEQRLNTAIGQQEPTAMGPAVPKAATAAASSPSQIVNGVLGALGAGVVSGVAGGGVGGATGAPGAVRSTAAAVQDGTAGEPVWGRFAAFLVGVVCIVAGLLLMRSTQVAIQTVATRSAEVAA